jgi:hypothetical protein
VRHVRRIAVLWRLELREMDIEQAFDRHQERLMAVSGVTGVGIGDKNGKPAIVIMVKQLTPDLKGALPQVIEGHPVVIEQSGEISAF